jgi:hypothetical protein
VTAVVGANASIAQAQDNTAGQQQAAAIMHAAADRAPQAAATPGGTVQRVPGRPIDTAGRVLMRADAKGCDKNAALLAAGKIHSYRCSRPTVKMTRSAAGLDAVDWPGECSSTSGTLTGWIAIDRRNACNHVEIDIITTLEPSGEVIGTTDLHAVSTASATGATWANTTFLWLWDFTGVGAPSFAEGLLFPSCSTATCLGTGGTWTTQADGESWKGTGNAEVTGLTPGVVDNNVGGFWEYTLGGEGWGNTVTVENYLALSRCDNATPGTSTPGCVFGNIPGVLGFSQTTVPNFVQHVYGAQVSGLPGRLDTGTYLTRLTDGTLSNQNGAKACPASLPRPTGYQCDEYPFRSTYEGASTSGATQARSLPWCQMPDPQRTGPSGWSRCFIPSGENSSSGGTTGAFYRAQRMLAHDPFEIGYLP